MCNKLINKIPTIKKTLSQIRFILNSDNVFLFCSISCNSCGRGYYGGDGSVPIPTF